MTTVDAALWVVRVVGIVVAATWLVGLLRIRSGEPFEGRGRVETIAVAFIVVGLVAFAVSFIPLGGF